MGILSRLNFGIAAGILGVVLGCSSVRTGFGYREVSGGYRFYSVDRTIPFARIQANKEIARNLEGYGRFDFTCGSVDAQPEIMRGSAEGHFESVGAGLSYYLTPEFSLDFGGEIFRAGVDMNFNGRGFRITTPDSILGAGINFGATFERKINDKAFLFISGGYNLNDSVTERCDADFNGFYGIVGFGVKF